MDTSDRFESPAGDAFAARRAHAAAQAAVRTRPRGTAPEAARRTAADDDAGRLDALLDRIPIALVIIDADCAILHANVGARRLFATGAIGVERTATATLRLRDRQPNRRLAGHVRRVAALPEPLLAEPLQMPLGRGRGEGAALLRVVPMRAGVAPACAAPAALRPHRLELAVTITTLDSLDALDLSHMALLFGLTRSELTVLELLCRGLPNKEIARRRIVSVETVRNQVRSLLAKTDSANRTMLVRRALSGLSPLRHASLPALGDR